MNTSSLRTGVAALLVLLCASAGGQQEPRAELQSFQSNDGYDEARFGGQDVTIKTRQGEKTLHVSFSKLRVAQTEKMAEIRLPGTGLALLQHAAGTAKFVAGREKFAPLEGEWLRLPLPAQFSLGTDNDSITLDLIVIEERGR